MVFGSCIVFQQRHVFFLRSVCFISFVIKLVEIKKLHQEQHVGFSTRQTLKTVHHFLSTHLFFFFFNK